MKKLMILLTALSLLLLCVIPAQASVMAENVGELPLAGTAMTLDGEMDDPYTGGLTRLINRNHESYALDFPAAQTWLVWEKTEGDVDYLWCYVEVDDFSFSGGGAEFYMRDSVELFLNFENSDAQSDVYQHIVDVEGNCKEFSDPNGRNVVSFGENGKINTVADESEGEYFSAVALQQEGFWSVEYRVPCEKLEDGKEIAFSMQTHDYPSGAWNFIESNQPTTNWDPSTYDYFVVSSTVAVPKPRETLPEATNAPEITEPPEIDLGDEGETSGSEQSKPAGTQGGAQTQAPEKDGGCSSSLGLLPALMLLPALPLLKRRRA